MQIVLIALLIIMISLSFVYFYTRIGKKSFLFTTAYFPIKNARNNKKYIYFDKTLIVNCNYDVFGNSEFTNLARDIRRSMKYNTFTNFMKFDDLVALAETCFECENIIDKIREYSINKFKYRGSDIHCVSPELLLIWMCKLLLVKQTMIRRPHYKVYGWIDAGYTTYANGTSVIPSKPFPTNDIRSMDMNLLYVNRLVGCCHPGYHEEITSTTACPCGGYIYASRKIMNAFIEGYIYIVKERLKNNMSVCTEQDLFEIVIRRYQIPVYNFDTGTYALAFIN